MYKVLALFLYFCGEIFIGMTITELQQLYAAHPNMAMMKRLLKDTSVPLSTGKKMRQMRFSARKY